MKVHDLKSWPAPFHAVRDGAKTAELRNNDRDYKVGDFLLLREFIIEEKRYTGLETVVEVTHIISKGSIPAGFAIFDPYVIMSIKPVSQETYARIKMGGHGG